MAACAGGRLALTPGFFIAPGSIRYANASTHEIAISDALEVHACFNPEACAFDAAARTFSCAHGYSGALCGVCDVDAGYMRQGDKCTACPSTAANVVVLLLVVLLLAAALVHLVLFRKADVTNRTSILIRIGLTYVQALGSLGIYKARGTEAFRRAMGLADTVGTSIFAFGPVACLLRPSFYTQFGVMLALPFIAAAAGVLIKGVYLLVKHRDLEQLRSYLRERGYIAPAVMVLYACYPMMVSQAFRALDCRADTIDGVRYLKSDLSIACGTSDHMAASIAAIAVLVAFGAGIPLAVYGLLHNRRHKLGDSAVFSKYGFLYMGYDLGRGMYWWESTVLVRKAGIVMLGSIISDPYYAILAATLATFAATVAHLWFRPYTTPLFNNIEGASLTVLCTTQILCILYLRSQQHVEDTSTASASSGGDVLLTIVLLLLNVGMLAIIAWHGVRMFLTRHSATFMKLLLRFTRLLPLRCQRWCCAFASPVSAVPRYTPKARVHCATSVGAAAQCSTHSRMVTVTDTTECGGCENSSNSSSSSIDSGVCSVKHACEHDAAKSSGGGALPPSALLHYAPKEPARDALRSPITSALHVQRCRRPCLRVAPTGAQDESGDASALDNRRAFSTAGEHDDAAESARRGVQPSTARILTLRRFQAPTLAVDGLDLQAGTDAGLPTVNPLFSRRHVSTS
ncbi:hypothetical protein EON66_04085 [archaeon]|nr:MAG: hypothetical protein EON66_04085 [archaeon]